MKPRNHSSSSRLQHRPSARQRPERWLVSGAGAVLACALTAVALAAPPAAKAPAASPVERPVTPEQGRFFETSIRPVLLTRCGACHGADRQSGGLRVDSMAALLKGGTRGPSLLRGNAEESLLIRAALHAEGAPKMPPGNRIPAAELANLKRWISEGAPWPSAVAAPLRSGQAATDHWSFQPVHRPAVPRVKNAVWVKTPIDAFILAELEKRGLKPSSAADRRTLIRRATYDLTGLPPTPAEVDQFVNDRSANAWPSVIERLLASSAYGEKWGRHWLDVARYADTNGMDENVYLGNAWRYRDYVVRSFNQDKPYQQFLQEQIAGDLLPSEENSDRRRELQVATGFLAIGPKVISEVDDLKMEMDTIDEHVDTLGRATMGLTIGCARCHDHKFDPISTADYYGLAGIFKSTKFISVWAKPRRWFEHDIATEADRKRLASHTAGVNAVKQSIAKVTQDATEALKAKLAAGAALPKNPEPGFPSETQAQLKELRADLARLEKDAPEMPGAMGLAEGTPTDLPIHIRGDFLNLGEKVERRFPKVLLANQPANAPATLPKDRSGRLELARWLTRPEHPLTARVMVNRVWRWRFGQGVVRTTDNFGLLGEKPSHPELLDYLASRFAAQSGAGGDGLGGSLKALHRLMMLSNTYQQASEAPTATPSANPKLEDPENRLLWRWEPRRLTAEELRDSLLATSGKLDRAMGGAPLPLKNRDYLFDHTSKDNTKYDSVRRSIYVPVIRNHLYDVFHLFDFGDGAVPNGDRTTTTVPSQALFLLNSELVMDNAATLAAKVVDRAELEDSGRIGVLYETLYSRTATAPEVTAARRLLQRLETSATETDSAARKKQAWSWLTHTLIAGNEFIYVR